MVSGLKISNFKITTMVRGWGWGARVGGGGSNEIIYSSPSIRKKYLNEILLYTIKCNILLNSSDSII